MAIKRLVIKKNIIISSEKFFNNYNIKVYKTKNLYSDETIKIIKNHNLDILLLIGGFGIIKEPILSITPFGILSYHHGDMRKYRGMPPAFWELYNGENEMGVTVQILSKGLDCGIPIEEKRITINKFDSLKNVEKRAYQESSSMMYNALKKLTDNNFRPNKIDYFGKIYTLPNLNQWINFNLKIFWRRFTYFLKNTLKGCSH